jgi:hypothetical protein
MLTSAPVKCTKRNDGPWVSSVRRNRREKYKIQSPRQKRFLNPHKQEMEQPNGLVVEDYNSPSPIVLGGIALVCLLLPLAVLYLVWIKKGRPQQQQHKGAGLVRSASTDTPTANRAAESSGGQTAHQRRRLREDGRVQHSEEIDLRSTSFFYPPF